MSRAPHRASPFLLAILLALSLSSLAVAQTGSTYHYVYWSQFDHASGSATGTIALQGGDVVTVTFQAHNLDSAGQLYLDPATQPGNRWEDSSTYKSDEVLNAPTWLDNIVLLRGGGYEGGPFQHYSVEFSAPVEDLIMPVYSLGNRFGYPADYDFEDPFEILSQGPTAAGNGTLQSRAGDVLHGVEGSGTIRFTGTFAGLAWAAPTAEFFHGFTFGIRAVAPMDDDGDGVDNNGDDCPDTPEGELVNEDGCSASQLDEDRDGVTNALDMCPATNGDTMSLNPNQWAWYGPDPDFTQGKSKGRGSGGSYTISDTHGCSCTQIVAETGAGRGHLRKGCSNSLMASWVATAHKGVVRTPAETPPAELGIGPAYPNPFSQRTRIRFGLPETAYVTMTVHDVLGRQVLFLVNGVRQAGTHQASLDAGGLPSGLYFVRMTAPDGVVVRAVQLAR